MERLSELGWIEGRTVAIEYRWSEGRPERVAEIAAEFAQQKVDVIVAYGSAITALKRAAPAPLSSLRSRSTRLAGAIVANLSHPGGNVTGMSLQQIDIAGKRLELLHEVVPNLHRLATMFDAGYSGSVREIGEVQAAARSLSLEVALREIRRAKILQPSSRLVNSKRTHFTSWKTLSLPPTAR